MYVCIYKCLSLFLSHTHCLSLALSRTDGGLTSAPWAMRGLFFTDNLLVRQMEAGVRGVYALSLSLSLSLALTLSHTQMEAGGGTSVGRSGRTHPSLSPTLTHTHTHTHTHTGSLGAYTPIERSMVFTIPKTPTKGISARSLAASTEGVRPTPAFS